MIFSPVTESTHRYETVKSIDMANREMDKTYPIID
jgi:hypothetical protein